MFRKLAHCPRQIILVLRRHRSLCDSLKKIAANRTGNPACRLAGLGGYYEDNVKCLMKTARLMPNRRPADYESAGLSSMPCDAMILQPPEKPLRPPRTRR